MLKRVIALAILVAHFQISSGQRITYFVSFPNINHHEAQITLVVSDIPSRNAVFRMSRSSPGRYATHEFGKNVYDVRAFDQQDKPLTITRTDGDVWEVPHAGGYVRLRYTLYADYPDGTYAGIDPDRIHLNMPAAFMWIKGLDNTPISIHFTIPDSLHWTVATQLEPTNDPFTFTARGLQYFMDSPVKIGPLNYRKWEITNPDKKKYTFRIALDGTADEQQFTGFSEKVKNIVNQEQAVFGETPAYDFGSYTFLASINPYIEGDGMEHRNSTMISIPTEFSNSDSLLEVFAHEFFHCWNVKRIRPKSLEPFNFEKSNMSQELWFAEGFTNYYGYLMVTRSGIGTDTGFVKNDLLGPISLKVNRPGARLYSPIESSEMAVFVDRGVAADKTNYPNFYSSYYPYGEALALALDLQLREKYQKTLDDLMQAAWKKFGKPEIPYTVQGLEEVLASITDKPFAQSWFEKYIYGHEPIDYDALLAPAGFILRKHAPGKGWFGTPSFSENDGVTIASNTIRSSPLYEAGLDLGDKILAIDNHNITSKAQLLAMIGNLQPGTPISIRYLHHDREQNTHAIIQEDPALEIVTFESAGQPVTPAITLFRKDWLGPKTLGH